MARPSTGLRITVCLAIAAVAGFAAYLIARSTAHPRDFAQLWYAARVLLGGGDPYSAIGPGQAFEWPWPLYYPMPAAILAIPFTPLPQALAMGAFSLVGAGAMAWALSRHDFTPLVVFLSACTWDAILAAQWSPLLVGASLIAPLSIVLVAKPTVGAALFASRPSWWAVGGGIALVALSFLLQPQWVEAWLHSLSGVKEASGAKFPSIVPVTLPGGPIALAAALRWRRPEGRLLAALACVPQTMGPYESVLLFLVPRGWRQSAVLVALSNVAVWWMYRAPAQPSLAARMHLFGTAIVVCMYVPATVMVLMRPNQGAVPEWLEQRIASWPAWIRGRVGAPA